MYDPHVQIPSVPAPRLITLEDLVFKFMAANHHLALGAPMRGWRSSNNCWRTRLRTPVYKS